MKPRYLGLALLLVGGVALALVSVRPDARGAPRAAGGGTFNVILEPDYDSVDPALAYGLVLDPTCAQLMRYPDKAPPAGLRLVPEVAAAFPRVSNGGRTYSFTLRSGFRFSDGTAVRANAFARAINRSLDPSMHAWAVDSLRDIVGAQAVLDGRATTASGVVANGNHLVVRFVHPAPDFPAQTTMSVYCAVPPNLPPDPEGVGAYAGSGPYYVSEYIRGKRIVLDRNRYYGGNRPHHVDRFVIDVTAGSPGEVLDRVEKGQADWGWVCPPCWFDPAAGLVRKYGINGPRFFVKPGLSARSFTLNLEGPLFRDNLALRRAVNFAIDRAKLVHEAGSGTATDQYLPPSMPGFKDAHLYPLNGPNVAKARELARGHLRGGKAVLWTYDVPPARAAAQIVKRNMKAIGLDVEVKLFPPTAMFPAAARPQARFDILFTPWTPDYIDPFQYTGAMFDSRYIGSTNVGYFRSPKYDALLRGAGLKSGSARARAFGDLDVRIARDVAPRIAVSFDGEATFVSKRVGCIVLRPTFDLTAACLK